MSDGFIEITTGAGLKIDAESLTVASENVFRERSQVAGASALEIARVLNDFPSIAGYALAVRRSMQREAMATLIATTTLDDSPTFVNSANLVTDDYRAVLVYLEAQASASPPTALKFITEFSDDDGTTYYQFDPLTFQIAGNEIPDTPDFYRRAYLIPTLGRDSRFRLDGIDTDATRTFSVELRGEYVDY